MAAAIGVEDAEADQELSWTTKAMSGLPEYWNSLEEISGEVCIPWGCEVYLQKLLEHDNPRVVHSLLPEKERRVTKSNSQ